MSVPTQPVNITEQVIHIWPCHAVGARYRVLICWSAGVLLLVEQWMFKVLQEDVEKVKKPRKTPIM